MPTIIRTDRLFDGTGSAPYAAEVMIDGEHIIEISRASGTIAPEDASIITLGAGTLLPGLIDADVHLVGSGEPGDNAFGMGDLECSIPTVTLHMYKNAWEIELMMESGLSATEALVAATGAAALDFPEVGRIAPECYADLVFVADDPLADIAVLQDRSRIALVMKGGAVVADRRAGTAVPAGHGVHG
jgi:imidazolonepropionase-like amidohydrolase